MCSTAVRRVPGSNPGSGMDVVFVQCWFSLSSVFLVTAVWNRRGKWKKSLLPMSIGAMSFVLNWLTVEITKSSKSSNCHLSFFALRFRGLVGPAIIF